MLNITTVRQVKSRTWSSPSFPDQDKASIVLHNRFQIRIIISRRFPNRFSNKHSYLSYQSQHTNQFSNTSFSCFCTCSRAARVVERVQHVFNFFLCSTIFSCPVSTALGSLSSKDNPGSREIHVSGNPQHNQHYLRVF